MKIQRRRQRAEIARNPDRIPAVDRDDELADGELSNAEEIDDVDLDNEVNSHLEQDVAVTASGNGASNGINSENGHSAYNGNGHGNGEGDADLAQDNEADTNSSATLGNGSPAARTHTVIPNLPRRRARVFEDEDAEEMEPLAPPPPVQPPSRIPSPPGGVALPPKSKGAKQSAQATPVVPSTRAASSASARQSGPVAPSRPQPAPAPRESLATQAFRLIVTYENLIFMIIFAVAIISRFWDIGNRGIHHDESLHSVYSRNLYIGTGYTHDPMMHGPLQFNFIAVMFWLFGTSDTTTRFASAICGIFVVMSPFFLRKQMGRWPAMIASFLLLISPTVLYFSRMAREDSVYSGMEMLMIVGLWRFISTRKPSDFFVFMAGLSLMFTIKETAYLMFAVMAIFFVVLFAYQAGYAILGALAGYGVVMGGFYLFISGRMKSGEIGGLPNIPVTSPDYNTIMAFVGSLLGHPLVIGLTAITLVFIAVLAMLFITQRRHLAAQMEPDEMPVVRRRAVRTANGNVTLPPRNRQLPSRRARPVDGSEEVTVATNGVVASTNGHVEDEIAAPINGLVASQVEMDQPYDDLAATEMWDPKRLDPKPGSFLGHYQPGSLPYLVGSLFSRPSVILIGALIASAIFIVLYSVFFTDVPRGILSGLFASLGYWMAQQGVARGDQPWYYYFLIVPLYEPIAVFFSVAATIFFSAKGIRGLLRRREDRYYSGEPGLGLFNTDRSVPFAKFSVLLPAFTVWWCLAALFLYSWAGEKMPWLTMHLTRPAILLASLFLGALLASILSRRQERMEWAGASVGAGAAYGSGATIPLADIPPVPQRRSQDTSSMPQRRRGAEAIPPPPNSRRRSVVARSIPREQEPPWISWNRPESRFPALSFLVVFVLLTFAWGLKMNWLAKYDMSQWGVSWIYPMLMVILVIAYSVWLGPSRALRYLALGIFSILFVYEFKSTTALSYQHPDVPIEMATYVQTSPDVTRSVRELNDYSNFATGGTNLKVVYDSFASWPYEWYLRDFKNKQFIGDGTVPTGPDVPVMFLEYAKHNNDANLSDYVVQRYAMRWWFPEETYKQGLIPGLDYHSSPATSQIGAALGTTVSSITDPGRESSLWKYLLFRQLPNPLGSEDMVLVIRKDIAQTWHYLQYEPPVINDTEFVVRDPNAQ